MQSSCTHAFARPIHKRTVPPYCRARRRSDDHLGVECGRASPVLRVAAAICSSMLKEYVVPAGLLGELLLIGLLALLSMGLAGVLVLRRRQRGRRLAVLVLAVAVLVVVTGHSTRRIVGYCNQSNPHVDCVPDRLDGVLWRVYRPARRFYRSVQHFFAQSQKSSYHDQPTHHAHRPITPLDTTEAPRSDLRVPLSRDRGITALLRWSPAVPSGRCCTLT